MFTASSSTCDNVEVNKKILFESLVVNSTKGPGELLSCDDREDEKKSELAKSYTGQGCIAAARPVSVLPRLAHLPHREHSCQSSARVTKCEMKT